MTRNSCTETSQQTRWQTPPEIWTPIHAEFEFDLDAFADEETKRLPNYLTDALGPQEWPGKRVWMNPPYGDMLDQCVRRGEQEAAKGKLVVALIPFRCRAAWWHEAVIGRAYEVRCIRKRVRFVRLDGSRGGFTGSCDSCLVIWRGAGEQETLLRAFGQLTPAMERIEPTLRKMARISASPI